MPDKRKYTKSTRETRLALTMARIYAIEKNQEKALARIGLLREKAQKIQNRIDKKKPTAPAEPSVG